MKIVRLPAVAHKDSGGWEDKQLRCCGFAATPQLHFSVFLKKRGHCDRNAVKWSKLLLTNRFLSRPQRQRSGATSYCYPRFPPAPSPYAAASLAALGDYAAGTAPAPPSFLSIPLFSLSPRVRRTPTLLNYGMRTTRKPRLRPRSLGVPLLRYETRQNLASLSQQPPRITRSDPDDAPCGLV